jgi:hypothetical protein
MPPSVMTFTGGVAQPSEFSTFHEINPPVRTLSDSLGHIPALTIISENIS